MAPLVQEPKRILSLLPSTRGHDELKHDLVFKEKGPALPALMTLILPSEPLVG